jgi:secreted trypsin-like serine protease
MTPIRNLRRALTAAVSCLAFSTAPAQAVDVGHDAPAGAYPSIAEITFGKSFLCTGTLIAPTWVLSAGHCGSMTAGTTGSFWAPGTLERIVGRGTTSEGGDTPDRLQEAPVPVTTDDYCGGAYDNFDAATMLCAGYPQGGVDTCQSDSGGPLFGRDAVSALRVVGTTSFGEGCARGSPGTSRAASASGGTRGPGRST